MKNNKCYSFILLILISISGFAQEQLQSNESKRVLEIAKKSTEMMKNGLNLTDTQTQKVSEINLDFSKKMVTLFDKPESMFRKRTDFKKEAKDRKAKLKQVFTDKQMKLFEDEVESKLRKAMRKIMKKTPKD